MIKKRGLLRFGVLCLLFTLAYACYCTDEDVEREKDILSFRKELNISITILMRCANDKCHNAHYNQMVCDFIIENTKTVKRCDDDHFVSKEANTMCKHCWSKLKTVDPPPQTPQTPPKPPPETPETPLKNPNPGTKSWNISEILWHAAFDNFVANAISGVFTWIFDCFMWAYIMFFKCVLPCFIACLSIALWIAKQYFPALKLISRKLPTIVIIGWSAFVLYQIWFRGSYEYCTQGLFWLIWANFYSDVDQASNGERTQITHNTKADYHGTVTNNNLTINFASGAHVPSTFLPWPQLEVPPPMKQLSNLQDSEASDDTRTRARSPQVPVRPIKKDTDVRAARVETTATTRTSVKQDPDIRAVRVNTTSTTKPPVKQEPDVRSARTTDTADTNPVQLSNDPRAGISFMSPTNLVHVFKKMVQGNLHNPERKRGRDIIDAPTEDEDLNRVRKMKKDELKQFLTNKNIVTPKSALKPQLLDMAEASITRK